MQVSFCTLGFKRQMEVAATSSSARKLALVLAGVVGQWPHAACTWPFPMTRHAAQAEVPATPGQATDQGTQLCYKFELEDWRPRVSPDGAGGQRDIPNDRSSDVVQTQGHIDL